MSALEKLEKLRNFIQKNGLIYSASVLFAHAKMQRQSEFFHHHNRYASAKVGQTAEVGFVDDERLLDRIITAYQYYADLGKSENTSHDGSRWQNFFHDYFKDAHDALLRADKQKIATYFRNPSNNNIFYGFDSLGQVLMKALSSSRSQTIHAQQCLEGLARFAESQGITRLHHKNIRFVDPVDTEDLIQKIESAGWLLTFPNPFPHEPGLLTSKGIVSYRAPQAIYQAALIKNMLADVQRPHVVEIGGGLGRTAYYAHQFGLHRYDIVDLPSTQTCQAYFLGRSVGEDKIQLEFEMQNDHSEKASIGLLGQHKFLTQDKSFDLVLNVDSFTEMNLITAQSYLEKAKQTAPLFVSINHEINPFTVRELVEKIGCKKISRKPYWLREGYVEEIIEW